MWAYERDLGPGVRAMKQSLVVLLAGLLGSTGVLAQDSRRDDRARPPRKPGESRQRGESARERMVRRFDAASPRLGEPLPDVSGFTADGEPLSLRALKGDYKVLVFGCLT